MISAYLATRQCFNCQFVNFQFFNCQSTYQPKAGGNTQTAVAQHYLAYMVCAYLAYMATPKQLWPIWPIWYVPIWPAVNVRLSLVAWSILNIRHHIIYTLDFVCQPDIISQFIFWMHNTNKTLVNLSSKTMLLFKYNFP